MNIFYGWVKVDAGGWRYIFGGWWWVDIFYDCVEVGGVNRGLFWMGGSVWTLSMGGWG